MEAVWAPLWVENKQELIKSEWLAELNLSARTTCVRTSWAVVEALGGQKQWGSEPAVEDPPGEGLVQQGCPKPQWYPGRIRHEILVVACVE
jgi:hypothetical protein